MSAHFLYRCYDADGRLLYIGSTSNPARRLASHKKNRHQVASVLLQKRMAKFEVDADTYPTRKDAEAAERDAITAEQPLFNMQHRGVPGWLIEPDIHRYLNGQPTRDWLAYRADLGRTA